MNNKDSYCVEAYSKSIEFYEEKYLKQNNI